MYIKRFLNLLPTRKCCYIIIKSFSMRIIQDTEKLERALISKITLFYGLDDVRHGYGIPFGNL